jgi:hypothetical protein
VAEEHQAPPTSVLSHGVVFAWKGAVLRVHPAGERVNSPPEHVLALTQGVDPSALSPYDRTYLSAWYRTCVVALRNDAVGPQIINSTWALIRLHSQSLSSVKVGSHAFFAAVYECLIVTLGPSDAKMDYAKAIYVLWSLAWRVGVHGDN